VIHPASQKQTLDHAQWRVDSIRSLLEAQRALPGHTTQNWKHREGALITQLIAAEQKLERLKQQSLSYWPREPCGTASYLGSQKNSMSQGNFRIHQRQCSYSSNSFLKSSDAL
jgi:hypothetical protein